MRFLPATNFGGFWWFMVHGVLMVVPCMVLVVFAWFLDVCGVFFCAFGRFWWFGFWEVFGGFWCDVTI